MKTLQPLLVKFYLLASIGVTGCSQANTQVGSQSGSAPITSLSYLPVATPIHAFYLGHSLNSDKPDQVQAILAAQNMGNFTFREQFIPGSPLRWHWNEAAPGGSQPYIENGTYGFDPTFNQNLYHALDGGLISHLIVTDSVPRGGA